ncbi:MAG TPA: four helix bundle protein [Candidatus Omnitrophota bacterium]|nr:four helix bundle protein [Candidatus Omnitrophota bacterium]
MTKITSFKDLKIWNLGVEIVLVVYGLTKRFPKEEIYGLTSQIRRASVSIPANIAEGFRRFSSKEHKQYLHIAMGSLAELETELFIAYRLEYFTENEFETISSKIDSLGRMLTAVLQKFR